MVLSRSNLVRSVGRVRRATGLRVNRGLRVTVLRVTGRKGEIVVLVRAAVRRIVSIAGAAEIVRRATVVRVRVAVIVRAGGMTVRVLKHPKLNWKS
jgi:hypothetical protein